MKKENLILLFITLLMALLGVIPLAHAEKHSGEIPTVKEVKQETIDTTNIIKNYTADKRREATKEVAEALNSVDLRFDAMESRIDKNWDNMSKAARKKARRTLIILRRQRVRVAEKFGSLKYCSNEAWEYMKKGFLDSYIELRKAWEKAEKEY